MSINKRNIPSNNVIDPSSIDLYEYSDVAGSKKVSEVGRHLLPLGDGAAGFTTDATTARVLPAMGKNLAIYNNSNAIQAITLGESSSVTALSAGACSGGHVGIPCAPNAWTYIACGAQNWVKTTSANLIVFLIDDNSSIAVQSKNNAST